MTMQKKQKQPKRISTPDALKKSFPPIIKNDKALTALARIRPTIGYTMGKIYISFSPQIDNQPAIMQVNHPTRLPTWDEIVWVRYNVCPEIEDIACILPPLSEYINYDSGRAKYTMTMEDISIRRSMR